MKSKYISDLEEIIMEEERAVKDLKNRLRNRLGILNGLREELKKEKLRMEEGRAFYE